LVKVTVTASSEVMQAAQSLVGRVDAIYLPTDNMVITSVSAIMKVAEENKLPVVVGEVDALKSGGLATIGIEYYQLGRTTGEMALEVINGKKPAEMAIKMQPGSDIVISKKAAERIGLEISPELQAKAKFID
jgi:putative ABC transport system substrate-binding protein